MESAKLSSLQIEDSEMQNIARHLKRNAREAEKLLLRCLAIVEGIYYNRIMEGESIAALYSLTAFTKEAVQDTLSQIAGEHDSGMISYIAEIESIDKVTL